MVERRGECLEKFSSALLKSDVRVAESIPIHAIPPSSSSDLIALATLLFQNPQHLSLFLLYDCVTLQGVTHRVDPVKK